MVALPGAMLLLSRAAPWIALQFVFVAFSGHTNLLFTVKCLIFLAVKN